MSFSLDETLLEEMLEGKTAFGKPSSGAYNASVLGNLVPNPEEAAEKLRAAGFDPNPNSFRPPAAREVPTTSRASRKGSEKYGGGSELGESEGEISAEDIFKAIMDLRQLVKADQQALTALTSMVQNMSKKIEELEIGLKSELPTIANHLTSIGGKLSETRQHVARMENKILFSKTEKKTKVATALAPSEAYQLPSSSQSDKPTALPPSSKMQKPPVPSKNEEFGAPAPPSPSPFAGASLLADKNTNPIDWSTQLGIEPAAPASAGEAEGQSDEDESPRVAPSARKFVYSAAWDE